MKLTGACATTILCIAASSVAMLNPIGTAWAQPFGLDPEAPEPVLIEFKAEPELGDYVGRGEGTVDADGKRFYLKDVNVMAPLVLQVLAKDPARPVEVSLHRLFWEKVEWAGRTDAEGNWGYVGRVYHDVGIQLKAEKDAGFYVLAWQGPAAKPEFGLAALAPAAIDSSALGDDGSGGRGFTTYAITAIVILALAAFVWLRRQRSDPAATLTFAGVLIILNVLSGPATAQVPVVESDGLAERLLLAEQRISAMNDSLLIAKKDLESTTDIGFENLDLIIQNWEEIMQLGIQHQEFAVEMQSQVDVLRAEMQRKDRQLDRMIQRLETLIDEDRDAEPDPTHGGASLVSSCAVEPGGGIHTCDTCFTDVNARLKNQLELFELLRVIYTNAETAITAATMLGDAHSGWNQYEQAQWYETRNMINRSFQGTRQAYQQKYREFGNDLYLILQDFHLCEEETGGIADWYPRWGELFYNLIMLHYKPR